MVETQWEEDRWQLQNGKWLLKSARTLSDKVSLDGRIVSSDGPATPLTSPERDGIARQIKKDAWPIATAGADADARDLEPLSGPLDDARIVGLGEATHGAREFFSLKDRIFRFLVQKKGFTVFAIEAPWLTSLAIDRYITNGKGDPREALAGTFAVWDNQEVLDLIKWMRAYNVTRGTRPALRFVGIDIQDDPVAVQNAILDFIKLARPADLEIAAQRLACLTAQKTHRPLAWRI